MLLYNTALFLILFCWAAVSKAEAEPGESTLERAKGPNVVFILTDDQDVLMDSMDYMPKVKSLLTDHGTYYKHHYATVSLCCPSRVNMWTGKAAHNTNITDLKPPWGESTG
jgi:arylsulfatase A-like enzyme